MSKSKKKKLNVYRFYSPETGEHYTIRFSKQAYENLKEKKEIHKYSKKLKKHIKFVITNKVK